MAALGAISQWLTRTNLYLRQKIRISHLYSDNVSKAVTPIYRLQLKDIIKTIIQKERKEGGADINLQQYVTDKIISSFYALHEPELRNLIMNQFIKSTHPRIYPKIQFT
jgi:hypothetical protein